MIIPNSIEEIAQYVENGKTIFYFTASWCPDCTFIEPILPGIEQQFSEYRFVEIDRDKYMEIAEKWNIFGIPSFVVIEMGKEIDRFVDKNRKTKEEIISFIENARKK